ncbi:MAG: PqqD family protein [Alphaproteobacteria bacterium]|nr:PqqD family protein [Alphaproteobacteria bacterium]
MAFLSNEPLPQAAQDRLRDLALSESGFAFDPFSGTTFSVNPTGKAIIEALARGLSPDSLPTLLRERFDVHGLSDPERDVVDFLGELRRLELLPARGEL